MSGLKNPGAPTIGGQRLNLFVPDPFTGEPTQLDPPVITLCQDNTMGAAAVVWTNPTLRVRGIRVTTFFDDSEEPDEDVVLTAAQTSHTVNHGNGAYAFHLVNLGNGENYLDSDEDTANCVVSSAPVLPQEPINLTANQTGETQDVVFQWTANESGSAPEYYEVRVDGGEWVTLGNVTTYTFTGQEPGDRLYEVRAGNTSGISGPAGTNITVV